MRREMGLIRRLLEYVETSETEDPLPMPEMQGCTRAQVQYHVRLCEEAGYLTTVRTLKPQGPGRFGDIARLTWEGHEALDRMRREEQQD